MLCPAPARDNALRRPVRAYILAVLESGLTMDHEKTAYLASGVMAVAFLGAVRLWGGGDRVAPSFALSPAAFTRALATAALDPSFPRTCEARGKEPPACKDGFPALVPHVDAEGRLRAVSLDGAVADVQGTGRLAGALRAVAGVLGAPTTGAEWDVAAARLGLASGPTAAGRDVTASLGRALAECAGFPGDGPPRVRCTLYPR